MPAAAIGILSKFFITVGASAAVAKFAATVFVYAASTYLLNRAAKSLAPKSRSVGLGSGSEVNYSDTGAAVRIAYGLVRTGGMETLPPTLSSRPNTSALDDLHKVLTIAGHEIDSYTLTHFDRTQITNNQIGPVAFTMSDGLVSAGPFQDHAFIRRYRGTSTDSADRILIGANSSDFGNSRAPGIAKVALTFRFNQEVYRSVPTCTFTYQGKRCYDPRLDASPGAAPTNPSFIAWTRNSALCLADYLMATFGGEYPAADIDWDLVVAAANYCDGSVNIPGPSTQARYTCNGVLLATDRFEDNVRALVNSMLGRLIFRDGKWRMYAGSWKTPSFTILKEDWVSGLSIRFEQGRTKRFNRMRTWYVDSAREWQRMESLPRSNSTYLAADGGETIDAETEQLLCTNEFEAQRKGEFLLRQSRNQITVAGRLPPRFQDIALWDTGTIVFDHLGWSSKTFRAVGLDIHEDGSIDGVFAEEQSGDWTDLDASDYNNESDATLPAPNETSPTEPTSFTATPQINGTILFQWGRPIVQPFGTEFQIIRSTNSANAAVGTVVWRGVANPVPLVMPTSAHWYYVRSISNSQVSPYSPNTFGLFAIPFLESEQNDYARLTPDFDFRRGDASSLWFFESTVGATATYFPTSGPEYGFYRIFSTSRSGGTNNTLNAAYPLEQTSRGLIHASNRPHACDYRVVFKTNSGYVPKSSDNLQLTIRHSYWDDLSSPPHSTVDDDLAIRLDHLHLVQSLSNGWQDVTGTFLAGGQSSAVTGLRDMRARALIEANLRSSSNWIDIGHFSMGLRVPHEWVDAAVLNQPTLSLDLNSQVAFRMFVLNTQSGAGSVVLSGIEGNSLPIGTKFYLDKRNTFFPVFASVESASIRVSGSTVSATQTVTMVTSLLGRMTLSKVASGFYLAEGFGIQ